MASEITEEEDENHSCMEDKEAEKIRQIINYQKSLYISSLSSSSSSFSSAVAASSTSRFVAPRRSSSLLDLMKEGSSSLRRLLDMEHNSLGDYLKDYSVFPIIKPLLLWGSDTDDDPWAELNHFGRAFHSEIDHQDGLLASRGSCHDGDFMQRSISLKTRRRKLFRTKSYKSLPRFSLCQCGRFGF